jgi:peptide/nickel transport system permease protein
MKLQDLHIHIKFLRFQAKHIALKWPIRIFSAFVMLAFLSPFIANDKPLICKYKGEWLFPAFSFQNKKTINYNNEVEIVNYNMGKEWKLLETSFVLFPPCAYSPNTIDADNAPLKSPFDKQYLTINNSVVSLPIAYRHWFGTTQNGNDVLSAIIHGTKISLSVGIFGMLLASIIGISLGAIAGYYQNNTFKIGYFQFGFLVLSLVFAWFYSIKIRQDELVNSFNNGGIGVLTQLILSATIFLTISYVFSWIGKKIDYLINKNSQIFFPFDLVISKLIEILNSIPVLLLIISVAAIAKPSYLFLILILGFLSWTNIARIVRAEFIKAKHLDYVMACKAIGISNTRIIIKHILPNILPIVFVQIMFGMAGAVLIESALSFIGVGVPLNVVSWGSLLNEGQNSFSSWWLIIFPGVCVFTLILIYNKIATHLSLKHSDF